MASLFVVEFTPKSEWSQRISWLQTFNACGSVLGMAAAGFLVPEVGMAVAALLVLPAVAIGSKGLPVPGGPLHLPHMLTGEELAALVRHGGPSAAALHTHHWRLHTFSGWPPVMSPRRLDCSCLVGSLSRWRFRRLAHSIRC